MFFGGYYFLFFKSFECVSGEQPSFINKHCIEKMFEKFSVSKQLLQKVGVLKTLTKMLKKQPSEVFFKKSCS